MTKKPTDSAIKYIKEDNNRSAFLYEVESLKAGQAKSTSRTVGERPLGSGTCIERIFYLRLLLEHAFATDADAILYLLHGYNAMQCFGIRYDPPYCLVEFPT